MQLPKCEVKLGLGRFGDWESRDRLMTLMSCIIVTVLTLVCGALQQLREHHAIGWWDYELHELRLGWLNLGVIAGLYLAYMLINAMLFLMTDKRRSVIIRFTLSMAAALFLAGAALLLYRDVWPSGMRSVM